MNKKAMYKLTYGLFVLSARQNDKDNGCIVNTVEQVTTSPNRITVAINKCNLTHDMVLATGVFNVSILSTDAPFSLFERFGFQSGKDVDKLRDYDNIARSENGLFYLPQYSNAYLSAKVVQTMDLGSHTLFLADVTDAEVLSDSDPVTYDYYQKNIKPAAKKTDVKGWRCTICNYIYEGDPLPADFICPVCKHGAIDFEKIQ